MHTGIISFCDRVRYNIKSSETKDVILDRLERAYGIRILQRHWYRLDPTTAPQIQKMPHWACLRSNGNPYYMYLTRYDDVNIIYFIDKKVQPGYEKPRIILGRGMFSDDLFNDTILDGEMVRRTDRPGWIFLVNDVLAFCGKNLQDVLLPKRIMHAYSMFHKKYTADPVMDVCTYAVKKYVVPTSQSVTELAEFSKTLPYTNRGVYFWCHNNRLKPKLINFDDGLIRSVHRKVKDCPDFRGMETVSAPADPAEVADTSNVIQSAPTPPVVAEEASCSDGERQLWLRKTENPDIYDVFTAQQCNEKLGNAYVQSLVMSKRLRTVFKDLTVAMGVPFVCSYNQQFGKWAPIRNVQST